MEHLINKTSPEEKAILLQNTLISRATGKDYDNETYKLLRKFFMSSGLSSKLPSFVRHCVDLDQFWNFIKPKYAQYDARRNFLYEEFSSLVNHASSMITSKNSSETLESNLQCGILDSQSQTTVVYNYGDNYGFQGSIHGGKVEQTFGFPVKENDLPSLISVLEQLKIEKQDIGCLCDAIQSDPKLISEKKFGANVAGWIGKISVKSAQGIYKFGLEVLTGVISKAIFRYYGIE